MSILVTGGAGYIGSHTVKALQEKGYNVIAYDNLSTGHSWAVREGGIDGEAEQEKAGSIGSVIDAQRGGECQLIVGDIADTSRLEQVFDEHKIDAVVHFAASSLVGESCSEPGKYYENNVVGSKRLFDIMLSKGIDKLVFSSTCATYGLPENVPITEREKQQPINTYGWTKFIIERIMQDYARAYGLDSIALRYFNAAGSEFEKGIGEAHNPESHVIPLLLEAVMGKRESFSLFGQDYDTEDGSCIRDYIHVKDLAEAHVLAVERLLGKSVDVAEETTMGGGRMKKAEAGRFECFNLGTGQAVSVLELIDTVEKTVGKKVNVKTCQRREGDPPVLVADNAKAVNELCWKPQHSDIEKIVYSTYMWALKTI